LGRKIHPYGFRLKTIRDWNARWFAEGQEYQDLLIEDLAIRRMIHDELPRAGISKIEIERFPNQLQIVVWTSKPGIVIGRKGATVKAVRTKLRELSKKIVKVDVEEISAPDMDAQLVAENIAGQLNRRISHSRAMKRSILQAMRQGAEGIRVECGGRLSGAEMARTEHMSEGRVPRNTLRADLDYGFSEALTTFGRIGVKVWIYKGEVLPQKVEATDIYISE